MRKAGDAGEAISQRALEVGGEEQRKLRVTLQLVGQHRGFEGRGFVEQSIVEGHGERESANVVLAHGVAQTRGSRGQSKLVNRAKAQIMNICPIFCSSDIFFSNARAHLSPCLSRWMGWGC